jgi:membrane protein
VVLALLTATSFARALQRSYELAWRLPRAGLRAAWRPLALVLGLAVYVELLFLFGRPGAGRAGGHPPGGPGDLHGGLGVVVGVGVGPARGPGQVAVAGRRWAAHRGRLRRPARRLSAFYLPALVASNQQQYGLLGVAFTLFSWLSACAFIIVVATVVGAVLAEERGRLGQRIRASR